MSDLDHIDATRQPLTIPILGSQDGEYDAPSTDWDATPVRAALSGAAELAGVAPNTNLDAQVLNDLIGRLGAGLASVIDSAALKWDPVANIAGQPNDNYWGPNPLIGAGDAFVAPYIAADAFKQEALYHFNPARVFRSWDGRNWEDRGLHGLGSDPAPRGLCVGLTNGGATSALVAWDSSASGQIRVSTDGGGSWANGGTLPASFDGTTSFGAIFEERAFICARSQLHYSDDLSLNAEWARITTSGFWTGAPPNGPLCVASVDGVGIAFGVNGGPGLIHSEDGTTWAAASLPTVSDAVNALAWSRSHRLWVATSNTGGSALYTAPAGFGVWAERTLPSGLSNIRAVACLGRAIVVAAQEGIWISRDFTNWRRIPDIRYTEDATYPDQWERLLVFNGRLWVSRRFYNAGAVKHQIEYSMSAPLPAEFGVLGAW